MLALSLVKREIKLGAKEEAHSAGASAINKR
jgi:hypothetical protein